MITLVEARSETLDAAVVWMVRNDWMSERELAAKPAVLPDTASLAPWARSVVHAVAQALARGRR